MLALALMSQCEKNNKGQFVDIPDTAFLNALIDAGVDANGDSLISYTEAELVTSLCFIGEGKDDQRCDYPCGEIISIKGVEAFNNLDSLFCNNHHLDGYFDFSNNTLLKLLHCSLNEPFCFFGEETGTSGINGINITACNQLIELDCRYNDIENLDLSKNLTLEYLDCGFNLINVLDVSQNTALEVLKCDQNKLTSLDLSNNHNLKELRCGNRWGGGDNIITVLDISNNIQLEKIYLYNIPSLTEVCVWTMPFPPEGVEVYTDGSPNVYFTTNGGN